jgi:hypothetical protein
MADGRSAAVLADTVDDLAGASWALTDEVHGVHDGILSARAYARRTSVRPTLA